MAESIPQWSFCHILSTMGSELHAYITLRSVSLSWPLPNMHPLFLPGNNSSREADKTARCEPSADCSGNPRYCFFYLLVADDKRIVTFPRLRSKSYFVVNYFSRLFLVRKCPFWGSALRHLSGGLRLLLSSTLMNCMLSVWLSAG